MYIYILSVPIQSLMWLVFCHAMCLAIDWRRTIYLMLTKRRALARDGVVQYSIVLV